MKNRRIGIYIIGAYGSVSTCAMVGASGIAKGLYDEKGMITATKEFKKHKLPKMSDVVFGGCDLRQTTAKQAAYEYSERNNLIQPAIVKTLLPTLKKIDSNIHQGISIGAGKAVHKMAGIKEDEKKTVKSEVARFVKNLKSFAAKNKLDNVIVVNLASTEPYIEEPKEYNDLKSFETLINKNAKKKFVPSVLYAYGTFKAGYSFVNFTPALASGIPALMEMAEKKKIPHMGKDGKTGETLMKTVLAPMFIGRNMKVLSWEGYNILGNRDGIILDEPIYKKAKQADKEGALRKILNDKHTHTKVAIDYVPSLDDWKTAWNFIHFEGFMNTRMILQFIWQGCDSMLAAPLVLDLVRLTDLACVKKEVGLLKHLACFFKNPLEVEEQVFVRQFDMLIDYVKKLK